MKENQLKKKEDIKTARNESKKKEKPSKLQQRNPTTLL